MFSDDPRDWVIHVWHPDPLHPDNRPGAVLEFPEEPYRFGTRYLIVTVPGIVDSIDDPDDLVAGDDEALS